MHTVFRLNCELPKTWPVNATISWVIFQYGIILTPKSKNIPLAQYCVKEIPKFLNHN